ncbi:WhiB family transcriptional regulator [Micromonospora sp. DT44]|uniref:WhiB family transcriptional regulator n=1 Tax=Micromonospora sp. DT44 TaxID=3393439 RepID=UPI003CE9D188
MRNDEALQVAPVDTGGRWEDRGLCRQVDPEIFFPDKGESTRPAKSICARCEVQTECREAAMQRMEPFGVWGGLSERERRAIKRRAA